MHLDSQSIRDYADCLFLPWIGMADRDADFPHAIYTSIDLDDPGELRNLLRKDIVPILPRQMRRQDAEKAIKFAQFAAGNPDKIDIEGLFDTYLITMNPPKDRAQFFRIMLEECVLNNPNIGNIPPS